MTRWLVTGAGGMLGRDVVAALARLDGVAVTAVDRAAVDITDPVAVSRAVRGHDVVVNAAAWTDVDAAERAEAAATEVNATAVGHLAGACAAEGARLLHVSTDYVFPGTARVPYEVHDAVRPVNAYGRSKLAGEVAVRRLLPGRGYVVRTAWLYGEHGANVVATMLRLAARRSRLDAVVDQTGQPTWSAALAEQLVGLGQAALVDAAPPGVYHGTSGGSTTWYGLARTLFRLAGLDPRRVRPVTAGHFPRPAARPAYSVLGHRCWDACGVDPQPAWQAQLRQALARPAFASLVRAAREQSAAGEPAGDWKPAADRQPSGDGEPTADRQPAGAGEPAAAREPAGDREPAGGPAARGR